MSDVLTVDMDTSKANARLLELQAALIGQGREGDAATVVEDESRLCLTQIIRLTPPKNKKQGEDAVGRDLLKLFTPVDEEMLNVIGSQHGVSGIDAWITTAGDERVNLKWNRIDPSGAGMEAFHHHHQNRRGRTSKLKQTNAGDEVWYAPYVISREDFAAYMKKFKARVGRRKAGWGKSLLALGGKVTSWISRHNSGAKGKTFIVQDPQNPSVTMGNFSRGIREDERIVRSALRIRHQAMGRRLKLILSGYSKDVAAGIRVSRKARKTPLQETA